MIFVRCQGKSFNTKVIQVYGPTSNNEEAEAEQFYEDLQVLLELTSQRRYHFHYRQLECKSRKSRNTWSNRQIWPWSTEWSRAKSNRVLPKERITHSKHPLPTTQEKTLHMDITKWSILISDWLYSLQPKMEKLYQFSSVAQSCPTLCDPMNHSTPGLPVHHHLPEFTQTHVHQVSDTIQLSHPR